MYSFNLYWTHLLMMIMTTMMIMKRLINDVDGDVGDRLEFWSVLLDVNKLQVSLMTKRFAIA